MKDPFRPQTIYGSACSRPGSRDLSEHEMSPIYEEESISISIGSKDPPYVNGDFQRRLLEEELRLRNEVGVEHVF